ncbi:MAG: MarR family transcriptional regulator [Vitreimonas sp.]
MSKHDPLEVADHLHTAAIRLLRRVRLTDDEIGLSAPKLSALAVLVFGGATSLKALARSEQVTAPTMSKLVTDLEAAGLAAKRVDKHDKRGVRIEVTAKGRALMEAGRKRRLALLRDRLAMLTREERALLDAAAALMLKVASPS